jgi:competence protein ComEA
MNKFLMIAKTVFLSLLLAGSAFAAEKVNINTADASSLDRVLIGVGPSKAEAIVQYRKQNGAFKSADQLTGVKGIGLATVEKNRDRIMVGAVGAAPAAKPAAKLNTVKTAQTKPVIVKTKAN